jgi:hypothetical protein
MEEQHFDAVLRGYQQMILMQILEKVQITLGLSVENIFFGSSLSKKQGFGQLL